MPECLVTKTIRYKGKFYRLKEGENINAPKDVITMFEKSKYVKKAKVSKPKTPKPTQEEHIIKEEGLFGLNFNVRKEDDV